MMMQKQTNKQYKSHSGILLACLAIIFITLFSCKADGNSLPDISYKEISQGTQATVLPTISIDGVSISIDKISIATDKISKKVVFTLKTIGTGADNSNLQLPTIDPNTGVITVLPTTTAGTYKIIATIDIDGTSNIETMFYVTTSPKTLVELNEDIATGIDKYGLNGDFNYIKTSTITNMTGVFSLSYDNHGKFIPSTKGRGYLNGFNGDISLWDVRTVTTMEGMFYLASEFNRDISLWDVSAVTTMKGMFYLASEFNRDISLWDVSSVTTMESMFSTAFKFNADISNWEINNVMVMDRMFYNALSFVQNLNPWETRLKPYVITDNMFVGSGLANNPPNWYP